MFGLLHRHRQTIRCYPRVPTCTVYLCAYVWVCVSKSSTWAFGKMSKLCNTAKMINFAVGNLYRHIIRSGRMWPLAHKARVSDYMPHMWERVLQGLHSGIPNIEFPHVQRCCNKFWNGKRFKGIETKTGTRQGVGQTVGCWEALWHQESMLCAPDSDIL